MAQSISLWGANYTQVPSVLLPKTGGGTAIFADPSVTTAVASDVAQGKNFLLADGSIGTGTASGGGGASNFVEGTFTTPSAGGVTNTALSYSGNGYPIAAMVYVDAGYSNSDYHAWYDLIKRYNIGFWAMSKSDTTAAPAYSANTLPDQATIMYTYKNSASSATSHAASGARQTRIYNPNDADTGNTNCVRFKNNKTLSVYSTGSASYALAAGVKYRYIVVYSA